MKIDLYTWTSKALQAWFQIVVVVFADVVGKILAHCGFERGKVVVDLNFRPYNKFVNTFAENPMPNGAQKQ